MDVILDLDGTIADCSDRLHWVKNKPKNWKKFFDGIKDDKVIQPVHDTLDTLALGGVRVIIITGRGEEYRKQTEKWLEENVFFPFEKLYMRKLKDHRQDDIVKKELLDEAIQDGYNPTIAFEDRARVRDMYANNGIFVFDVSHGKGDF